MNIIVGHDIFKVPSLDEEEEDAEGDDDVVMSRFFDNKENYMSHDNFRIYEDSDACRKVISLDIACYNLIIITILCRYKILFDLQ